jgi:hypothetical protein
MSNSIGRAGSSELEAETEGGEAEAPDAERELLADAEHRRAA